MAAMAHPAEADDSIYDLSDDGLAIQADTQDQFVGGVHLGYNLQGAHILYGIEGHADFAEDISFLGSIRGRLGWAGEHVMVLGVGFVNADAKFTISSLVNAPTKLSHEISEVAFVAGGGLDFKVLPRVSLGAEGLFYDFANEEAHLIAAGARPSGHDRRPRTHHLLFQPELLDPLSARQGISTAAPVSSPWRKRSSASLAESSFIGTTVVFTPALGASARNSRASSRVRLATERSTRSSQRSS